MLLTVVEHYCSLNCVRSWNCAISSASSSSSHHNFIQYPQDQLNVNFLGTVTVSQAMLPALEDAAASGVQPVLAVVNSFAARLPIKEMAAYTASKAALAGWVDAVRPELVCLWGATCLYCMTPVGYLRYPTHTHTGIQGHSCCANPPWCDTQRFPGARPISWHHCISSSSRDALPA